MTTRQLYTYTFQVIMPSTGEIVKVGEERRLQTVPEFWEMFSKVTDWLGDHAERRCVIHRAGSDTTIDLIHSRLEAQLSKARAENPAVCEGM